MSLDLYLRETPCETCGHQHEALNFNYTYNVSPMWYKIYPDAKNMVDIDGMTGEEAYKKLSYARKVLESQPKEFMALNPSNGWGSYDGFLDFINELIKACMDNPKLVWDSCR